MAENLATAPFAGDAPAAVIKPQRDMRAELAAWKEEKAARLAQQAKTQSSMGHKPWRAPTTATASPPACENVPRDSPSKSGAKTPRKACAGAPRPALSERCPNATLGGGSAPLGPRSVSPTARQLYKPAPRAKTPRAARSPAPRSPKGIRSPVEKRLASQRCVSPSASRSVAASKISAPAEVAEETQPNGHLPMSAEAQPMPTPDLNTTPLENASGESARAAADECNATLDNHKEAGTDTKAALDQDRPTAASEVRASRIDSTSASPDQSSGEVDASPEKRQQPLADAEAWAWILSGSVAASEVSATAASTETAGPSDQSPTPTEVVVEAKDAKLEKPQVTEAPAESTPEIEEGASKQAEGESIDDLADAVHVQLENPCELAAHAEQLAVDEDEQGSCLPAVDSPVESAPPVPCQSESPQSGAQELRGLEPTASDPLDQVASPVRGRRQSAARQSLSPLSLGDESPEPTTAPGDIVGQAAVGSPGRARRQSAARQSISPLSLGSPTSTPERAEVPAAEES